MAKNEKVTLKVTQASLNQTALDYPRNMANIYEAIRKAAAEGSDILALEELAVTGYEANDDFQKTDNKRILAALDDIAAYAKALDPNLIISVGHPWQMGIKDLPHEEGHESERLKNPLYNRLNQPFNVQTFIGGGKILGMTAKANLFNDERGYEKRYFAEWSTAAADAYGGSHGTINIKLAKDRDDVIPFGRPIIHLSDGENNINLAHAICEEKWVATQYDGYPYDDSRYEQDNLIPSISRYLKQKKGLVLVLPNASPPSPLKQDKHEHLAALASQYADVVIDTDGLGSSGSTFAQFGHRIVAQAGKILNKGLRMCFARVATTDTVFEVSSAPKTTAKRADVTLSHSFNNKALVPTEGPNVPDWENPENPDRTYEETVRMTALWLFDYMRKIKCNGLAQALSGGADSAFNSVVVRAMVELGMDELGVEGFCQEMSHLPYRDQILAAAQTGGKDAAMKVCMDNMLTNVYMGTNNSSEDTKRAARVLIEGGVTPDGETVEGIGGKYMERNVQDLLDFYGVMYAVEDTTKLDDQRFNDIRREVAEFLNLRTGSISMKDLEEKEKDIKARFPEVERLVTAARESDVVAYENIQARGRQVLIMAIANMEGKMAIANPNLDEARNAYATFGGDLHSGTINLNAHLPKAYQLRTMRYLFDKGLEGVMKPVRSFYYVLKNKPSAELQPKNEEGVVVQNDEDALHGTFEQLNEIADYMLYAKTGDDTTARRMNAGEIMNMCKQSLITFRGLEDAQIYDMLWFRYKRWQVAQHKIHASPIAPTFGSNVDHQISLRTPNLSGSGFDELVQLGVKLLFERAEKDGLDWTDKQRAVLDRRSWQDEGFVARFENLLRNTESAEFDFDIDSLYDRLKDDGWDKWFTPLEAAHPIMIVSNKAMAVPSPS